MQRTLSETLYLATPFVLAIALINVMTWSV